MTDEVRRARIERLALRMAPLEQRSLTVNADELADVEEWRAAARLVARRGGWRIRTGVSAGGRRVWAVRTDREVTLEEQRAAMEALSYARAAAESRAGDNLRSKVWPHQS